METKNSLERYQRQITLKNFGEECQQRLSEAKVLVVGAGGLGCPALQYLAAAGVGTIGIADDDIVSLSDLHRQILYASADIGLSKVEVAAIRLNELNPDVKIVQHKMRLRKQDATEIIKQYEYILDGTDNFITRYVINDACVLLGKPLVCGAVSQYQGQLAVFNVPDKNGRTSNYRSLFPVPPKTAEFPDCNEQGVLGVLPGIIGTMQAAEIIKLVTGIGTSLCNKMITYDALTNEIFVVRLPVSVAQNSV